VNVSSGAPVRQAAPEVREKEFSEAPATVGTPESSERILPYLRLLWANRGILLRVVLYALLASTLVALVIPARYESTARLMPPDSQSSSGSALAMAAAQMSSATSGLQGMASEFLGLKSTSDLFVGILNSRTVQDKLIQQFDLKKLYWDRRMEDARIDLAEHTSISVDRKSQIIGVTVTDKSPQRAAAMAQAYVDELNRLVAELSTSSARRERIFLEGRLQAVTQDLETAEKEFSQFSSKNTAIDIKEQGRAMVEAAATLQGRLIAAQSEMEGLRQIYSDSNVRVRSVRARIDELQHELEKMGGKNESAASLSGQSNDSLYPSIRKLPLLGVTYADLYRRTKIQEAVLEALTKEYEMAKVQEVKEIPTVRVLDPANVPDKKSFPPRVFIVLLGTSLALCFGTAFLLGSASWKAIDPKNPGKQFAAEIWVDLKEHGLSGTTANGSGQNGIKEKIWGKFGGRSSSEEEP
jgi:uncharacterized protein involved in exopolysaccharide biosynthesis